jgi:hypothetical protein
MVPKLFLSFFAIQLYLTLFGGFLWPFSSHRLFSQLPGKTKYIVQIRLIDEYNDTYIVHPGRVIPIEYSRCSGLIRNVYNGNNSLQKEQLYNYMIKRVNERPWFTFDEMLPMANPKGKVINLNIDARSAAMRDYEKRSFSSLNVEEHLIQFDPFSVLTVKRGALTSLSEGTERREATKQVYPGNNTFTKINTKKEFTILNVIYIMIVWIFIDFAPQTKFFNAWLYSAKPRYSLRKSLYFVIIILLSCGPYGDFYTSNPLLFTGYLYLGNWFFVLKYFIIIQILLCLRYYHSKIDNILLAVAFMYFQHYITCFSTSYWITNTHLNIFLALTCLPKKYKSVVVRFCQVYIAFMYFQAGLSKLLLGGISWFLYGERIWTETLLLGTPIGKYLTQWPILFMPMGWFTFIVELIIPCCLLYNKYLIIIPILFHIGTYMILGISFWFVWILFPAIFL